MLPFLGRRRHARLRRGLRNSSLRPRAKPRSLRVPRLPSRVRQGLGHLYRGHVRLHLGLVGRVRATTRMRPVKACLVQVAVRVQRRHVQVRQGRELRVLVRQGQVPRAPEPHVPDRDVKVLHVQVGVPVLIRE